MCKNFMVIRHSIKELLAKNRVTRPMKCIVINIDARKCPLDMIAVQPLLPVIIALVAVKGRLAYSYYYFELQSNLDKLIKSKRKFEVLWRDKNMFGIRISIKYLFE